MLKKNVAVLVSGGGTNLGAIIKALDEGKITNAEIKLVIGSKEGIYALERAENAGIPTAVISKKSFATDNEFDDALIKTLKDNSIDLVVLAGYLTILSERVTAEYSNRMVNIHPALLPSFGGKGYYGLNVHEAVLSSGVKLTGATVHFVTEGCDKGPIIIQKAVEVKNGDTPELLQRRVMEEAEWDILPQAISLFCNDRIKVEGNKTIIE